MHLAANGVVQLFGVHPEMDVSHAQPIGAHGGSKRFERNRAAGFGLACLGFERIDQRLERGEFFRGVGGEPVCGGGEVFGRGQIF